jgi:pilus assembly protein Flp/PilA
MKTLTGHPIPRRGQDLTIHRHSREIQMIKTLLKQFWQDDSGASAIEYGLLAALIAVAIIGGAGAVGTALDGLFTTVAGSL